MKKGKLIVIEGIDSSGKATQANLLVSYLKNQKLKVAYYNFPQYQQTFYGQVVAKYLRGEFGDTNQISPYLSSILYALDRWSVKEKLIKDLRDGLYVVANRYVSSNIAHQGSKFDNAIERDKFINWLYEFEYQINQVPKEDLVIFLHVPWQIAGKLSEKKGEREYLHGLKLDFHEKDAGHQIKAEKIYLELAKKNPGWIKIDAVKDGEILPPEVIHQKIINVLKSKDIIPR